MSDPRLERTEQVVEGLMTTLATDTHARVDGLAATRIGDARPSIDAAATLVADAPATATAREIGAPVELERGALVGRYVVLSRLGAGGMGVVFAAYDPELERKVALKLLHPRLAVDASPQASHAARARLVREAQALARLNHPNIVAIHDVGEHQGSVWLAMEYVEGETLSAWTERRRRTWREVLDVVIPAARGLAAAHEAGIIHRDVKPDNIMLGADGRVRVMDLGLARGLPDAAEPTDASSVATGLGVQLTHVGAVMGTPAYMSPEQFRGESADARTDVFSLCVTLWEALMGERPFAGETMAELTTHVMAGKVRPVPRDGLARRVPGWLRGVCLQGLAVDPARRLASMAALLAALAQARRRARVRGWIAGAAVAASIAASAVGYQRHDLAARVAACDQAGAAITDEWNDDTRSRVREGLLATGVGIAPLTADRVMPLLDAQAAVWREQRTLACRMGDVDRTLGAELLDRAVWCLDERRMELAALVAELSRADAAVVQKAVSAAAGLPPVQTCTDGQVLASSPSPPPLESRAQSDLVRAQLSQARSLELAGKYTEGLTRTREALAHAEALGWPPLVAAALQLEGAVLTRTGEYAGSADASRKAYFEAMKARAWDIAASAATDLTITIGFREARRAEGLDWASHAEVAIRFAGDPLGLREAARLTALANVHRAAGAYPEAKALYEQSLAVTERVLGPDHIQVGHVLNNLAGAYALLGEHAQAQALQRRVLAITERAQGPDHPRVATVLGNLAAMHMMVGDYADSRAWLERSLAIQENTLGPEHPDVASTLGNLGAFFNLTGAYEQAKAPLRRALAINERSFGPDHPNVAYALSVLAMSLTGTREYAEAEALGRRALAIAEKALGPDHPEVAEKLADLGDRILTQDRPLEALPLLERAVAIFDRQAGELQGEPEARFNLARALVRTGGDRGRAEAEARKAVEGFRAAGQRRASALVDVEAFLATLHDPPVAGGHHVR